MRTRTTLLVVVALFAAACSDSAGYTEQDDAPAATTEGVDDLADQDGDAEAVDGGGAGEDANPPETTADASPSADVAPAPAPDVPDGEPVLDGVANSLVVVHDRDGGADALVTYRADGTKVASYATDDDALIWQPIWSPDGRRLAWTSSLDGATWTLVTASVDGNERSTHPLPGRPDYITFDPTASKVLALTPSPAGFGVLIVDVGADAESEAGDGDAGFDVIDLGVPYYSDFSPEGERLISHVATDIRIVGLGGELEPLGFASARHQAPAWHPSEDVVFFSTGSDDREDLVSFDVATGALTELATFEGFVLFDVAAAGDRLAVVSFPPPDEGAFDAFRRPAGSATPTTLGGGLWLVDTGDGTTSLLSDQPTVAPMFDPTGAQVLVRTGFSGVGRWDVFDLDGNRTSTVEYDVNGTLLPGYLPYWDQYVRSQTLWSPDGRYFVHVGADESGDAGVWVHDASVSGASSFLVEGDVAFWSPT